MGYPAEIEEVDVVLDGPPSPVFEPSSGRSPCPSGHFVEVEDRQRRSISVGEWVDRGDGTWALRLQIDAGRIRGRS